MELYGYTVLPFDLAIVSTYLTMLGALLLFGAIAVVGLGLIVGGLATMGEESPRPVVEKEVVVMQPAPSTVVYEALTELELSILRFLSQGKSEDEVAKETGVERSIISDKIAKLQNRGYITRSAP